MTFGNRRHRASALTGVTTGLMTGALVIGALAMGAGTAAAQDSIGEMTATIDGTQKSWRMLGPDGSGQDYNTGLRMFGPMANVSAMGFPPGRITMRGSVQLSFTMLPGSLDTMEQEVIFAPEGMGRIWSTLPEENALTITRFETDSEGGMVAGEIAGRLCLKESLFADPDPDNCQSIEGSFSTRLPLASD